MLNHIQFNLYFLACVRSTSKQTCKGDKQHRTNKNKKIRRTTKKEKTNYKNSSGHNETNSEMNILHENTLATKENKAKNHETKENHCYY